MTKPGPEENTVEKTFDTDVESSIGTKVTISSPEESRTELDADAELELHHKETSIYKPSIGTEVTISSPEESRTELDADPEPEFHPKETSIYRCKPSHLNIPIQTDFEIVIEKNCRSNFSICNVLKGIILGSTGGIFLYGMTTFGVPEGIFWLHAIIFYPSLTCLLLVGIMVLIDEFVSLFNRTRIEVSRQGISVTNYPCCNETHSIEFVPGSTPPRLSWEKVFQKVKRNNRTYNELVGYKILVNRRHTLQGGELVLKTPRLDDIWIVETVNNFLDPSI